MTEVSGPRPTTKPYLIRAIYEWCGDSGYTPYLAVKVDDHTQVPPAYVKNGEIILNIGADAVKNLHMANDYISCSGRFGGVSHELLVPVAAVIGIFSRESGEGMAFEVEESPPPGAPEGGGDEPASPSGKPQLRVVK